MVESGKTGNESDKEGERVGRGGFEREGRRKREWWRVKRQGMRVIRRGREWAEGEERGMAVIVRPGLTYLGVTIHYRGIVGMPPPPPPHRSTGKHGGEGRKWGGGSGPGQSIGEGRSSTPHHCSAPLHKSDEVMNGIYASIPFPIPNLFFKLTDSIQIR